MDVSPAILMLLGRFANLFVGILLTYYAIRLSPILKWFLVLLALMPMTITQYASLSADTLTIAVSLLFFALVMRARSRVDGSYKEKLVLISSIFLAAIVLGLCKQAYFPLTFLVLLIPIRFFNNKISIYLPLVLLFFTLSVVPPIMWNASVKHMYQHPHGQNLDERMQYILDNPLDYAMTVMNVLFSYSRSFVYFTTAIGRLGWLNVELPFMLHILPYFVLLFLSAVLNRKDLQSGFARLFILAVTLGNVVLVLTSVYIAWTNAFNDIEGVQGRYFIPLFPLFALLMSNRFLLFKPKDKSWKLYIVMFIVYSMLSSLYCSFLWHYK